MLFSHDSNAVSGIKIESNVHYSLVESSLKSTPA